MFPLIFSKKMYTYIFITVIIFVMMCPCERYQSRFVRSFVRSFAECSSSRICQQAQIAVLCYG